MTKIKNITTKAVMLQQLRDGKVNLPPISIQWADTEHDLLEFQPDAVLSATWGNRTAQFIIECRAQWTPKAFAAGRDRLKSMSLPRNYRPMLYLPFLDEEQLQELSRDGISGIDLCGNGVVLAANFAVSRTGHPNRFSSSAPIKNVYRKNSSLVGRVFLARPAFESVSQVRAEINRLNLLVKQGGKSPISLATVSKVLKTLGSDLVVTRADSICLARPEALLEKLAWNYSLPEITRRLSLKVPELNARMREVMAQAETARIPVVASGASSVAQYAAAQQGYIMSVYCPDLEWLRERLPDSRTDRFPNFEVIETRDETVYFNAREADGFRLASPVQTYLELMTGDSRDREMSELVKAFVLKEVARVINQPALDT